MIQIRNLTKRYGDFTAVDDINLEVSPGEIMGFLGPNGAGKTTTIKMMAGTLKPSAGTVVIGNYDIAREPLKAKQVFGFIPDRPFIYERLTGREFLEFMARLYRMNGSETGPRQDRLLELFELSAWQDEMVAGYSHGMKQRLVMAAALLPDPRVLIIDEPMVGLDPKAAKMVKRIFQEIAVGGVTIFMSTHSLEVAEETCDRIAIIMNGRIFTVGTVAELAQRAQTEAKDLEAVFLSLTGGVVTEVGDFLHDVGTHSWDKTE